MLTFIDTHTHLSSNAFDEDRAAVVDRASAAGVTTLIDIGSGYGLDSAARSVKVAGEFANVYSTVGLHPNDAACRFDISFLLALARHPKVVAIGETGLDFYRDKADKSEQEAWFRAQIELAKECEKPLVVHSRSAGADCLRVMEEEGARDVGGVFHCYAEDAEFAKKLVDLNFLISVPGIITFKNAGFLRSVLEQVPLSQIMLETDAPFLAPEPNRGKRCESAFMVETAKKLAEVKKVSLAEVAEVTSGNARRVFGV